VNVSGRKIWISPEKRQFKREESDGQMNIQKYGSSTITKASSTDLRNIDLEDKHNTKPSENE
jgi:hypothetical protein